MFMFLVSMERKRKMKKGRISIEDLAESIYNRFFMAPLGDKVCFYFLNLLARALSGEVLKEFVFCV